MSGAKTWNFTAIGRGLVVLHDLRREVVVCFGDG